MSGVERYRGQNGPLEHLRRAGWLRIRDRGRELVVGTPLALGVTRAAWAVGGGIALSGAAGVVLLVVQVTLLLGWLLLLPAGIAAVVFARAAAIEFGARDQLRKRNARERSRAYRLAWSDDEEPVLSAPAPEGHSGRVWGHVSRTQPALPPVERRLPQSSRRAIGG